MVFLRQAFLATLFVFLAAGCGKEKELKSQLPASENYFTYLGKVYQVNPAIGGVWLEDLKAFSTRSREDINLLIRFKQRPTQNGVYRVRAASANDPAGFADNECSISIISNPANLPLVLSSKGNEADKVDIIVSDGKMKASFAFIEMTYQDGGATKTANLTGSFFEK